MGLRENAAAKAGRADTPPTAERPAADANEPIEPAGEGVQPQELPEIDVDEPGADGPEQVPVHVAWSRVMGDIVKISKGDKYNGAGVKYDFRGVDRTVNAFAPVLRKHGVLVLPVKVEASYRDTKTSKGNPMQECTVTVSWMIVGPAGDTLPQLLQSAGEALDSMDKSAAKAQSVALRVLLLTAGMVPTGDPDPDSMQVERGEAPIRAVNSYRDEVLEETPSARRMHQMIYELRQQKRLGELTTNENGDEEPIGALIERHGRERFGGADA
ncbi:MAG: ERF family protein [Actinoallomurus sp.]